MSTINSLNATTGGRPSLIPMVNRSVKSGQISTPEWMVRMDDIVASSVEDHEDKCQLFGWWAEQGRFTQESTSGNLFSSGSVQHSHVTIVIPNEEFVPSLEQKMLTGSNIKKIILVRLSNIGETLTPLQEIEYTDCLIETMTQELDQQVITFRVTKRRNTVYQYSQDGVKEGQNVSEFDYTLNRTSEY